MSFIKSFKENIFVATSEGLVSWITVYDVNLIVCWVTVRVAMCGKFNIPKRRCRDLVPSISKTVSSLFSITRQDKKINLPEFDLSHCNFSVLLNTGVMNKIISLLNNLLLGKT